MFRRIVRIGRNFIVPRTVEPNARTVELLHDDNRKDERCQNCRFRSTMVDRCMRVEGPYYKAPVADNHVCDLFENKHDQEAQRRRLYCPRLCYRGRRYV